MKLRMSLFTALWMVSAVACGPSSSDGIDGGGGIDGAGSAGDANPAGDAPACLSEAAEATESQRPVDIIWVVDTSGSMDDESNAVQNALNSFSSFIEGSLVDHHVILIANQADMTVPAPLGTGPRFRHVNVTVGSTDALQKIVSSYAQYQDFLRPDAAVHFVVVTDDESNWSRATFDAALAGLTAPGFPSGYTFHAICSEENVIVPANPPIPALIGPCTGGLGGGTAAEPGVTYIGMSAATNGVWRSICSTDWQPIFTALAEAATVSAALPCVYVIPEPPVGQTLDPDLVNFAFTPTGGAKTTVPRRDSEAACAGGQGWYYGEGMPPTEIYACPLTCMDLSADPTGQVVIEFGCETVVE